jgi:hypothetical protein
MFCAAVMKPTTREIRCMVFGHRTRDALGRLRSRRETAVLRFKGKVS